MMFASDSAQPCLEITKTVIRVWSKCILIRTRELVDLLFHTVFMYKVVKVSAVKLERYC